MCTSEFAPVGSFEELVRNDRLVSAADGPGHPAVGPVVLRDVREERDLRVEQPDVEVLSLDHREGGAVDERSDPFGTWDGDSRWAGRRQAKGTGCEFDALPR